MGKPTIFISYSRKDTEFVRRLAGDLEQAGYDPWWDVADIRGGQEWEEEIEKHVRACAAMVVVLSPDSNNSEWVGKETLLAIALKKPIIPLMCRESELPFRLVDRQSVDFRSNYADGLRALYEALSEAVRPGAPPPLPPPPPKQNRKMLAAIAVVMIIVLGGLAWSFLLRPAAPALMPTQAVAGTTTATQIDVAGTAIVVAQQTQAAGTAIVVAQQTQAAGTATQAASGTAVAAVVTEAARRTAVAGKGGFSGRLVFLSKRLNDLNHLYLAELGSGQPAISLQPNLVAYSPSGTTTSFGATILVFSSADWNQPGGQLYWTGGAVGDDVVKIGDAPGESRWQPAISPDGKRVLFVLNWGGNQEIFATNLDGTNVVNLTHYPTDETSPAWSPDGQRIAFASKREGDQADIWTMNADGSDWKRLTSDPSTDTFPAWSPDGQYLAFVSTQDDPAKKHPDIFVLDLTSGSQRNLTGTPRVDENFPAWSPDGKWIAFTRYTTNNDIYAMPVSGGPAVNITNNSADDSCPIWLP